MAFSTYEWNVLIVWKLDPIIIFMGEEDGIQKSLSYMHVNTDPGIGGIFVDSGLVHRSNKISHDVAILLEGGFDPVLLRK